MNTLKVIKAACSLALEESEAGDPAWRAAYTSVVEPHSVLEMASIIETLLQHTEQTAPELAAKVRAAIDAPQELPQQWTKPPSPA
jgi:hypothetical protein